MIHADTSLTLELSVWDICLGEEKRMLNLALFPSTSSPPTLISMLSSLPFHFA